VAELVAPHPETLKLVNSWLEHSGIPSSSISTTHGGNTLMLKAVSVTQANALLNASYQLYRHVESSETTGIVRTVGYALPAALHRHVLTVVPTTSFFSPLTQWHTPRNLSGGAAAGLVKSASDEPATTLSSRDRIDYVTPSFLRSLYGTEAYIPAARDTNALGIVGFSKQYPSPADLKVFMRKYRSDGAGATFLIARVNGGKYDPSHPGIEANLDTQYTGAMAYPTQHIFYSTGLGPNDDDDWYISWLKFILDEPSIPQTISTSYGVNEKSSSREYSVYVCDLFAQLGARGVSVLAASGDDGVGKDCVAKDGSIRFKPKFPATCTCGIFSRIGSSTKMRVQDAHHIATLWQVPMSPPSAEQRTTGRRSQRIYPAADSRTTFNALITRIRPCPPSSRTSAAGIKAFTSAFSPRFQ